jgi:MFS family permease
MSRTSSSIELQIAPPERPVTAFIPNIEGPLHSISRTISSQNAIGIANAESEENIKLSKGRTVVIILSVGVITGISSLLFGLITVAIPVIAKDLKLESNLLLWPAAIFSLTCGCTLLVSGAVADVVGSRAMYLTGSLLQSVFTMASGLSQSGTELIVFRGLAGIAVSLCLPSAVSIITSTFPEGKMRNVAFASMGAGQPLGFSIGLVLGGVFADTIGWRWGFHAAAILNAAIFVMAIWTLPRNKKEHGNVTWGRIWNEIDWVGVTIASTSLALLSYVLV